MTFSCAGIDSVMKTVGKECARFRRLFRDVIEVHLIGALTTIPKFTARLLSAELIGEKHGVIIYTASVAARDGRIGQAAYSASTDRVVGMTLPIARDLARSAFASSRSRLSYS